VSERNLIPNNSVWNREFAKPLSERRPQRPTVHKTVQESNIFSSFELSLSAKSRCHNLLDTLVVRRNGWSCWSRGLCAQGRRGQEAVDQTSNGKY